MLKNILSAGLFCLLFYNFSISQTIDGDSTQRCYTNFNFPYGMYVYGLNGIKDNGAAYQSSEGLTPFLFWNKYLQLNSFMFSFDNADELVNFKKSCNVNQLISNNQIIPFIDMYDLRNLCETHYLSFSRSTENEDKILFNTSHYNASPISNGWLINLEKTNISNNSQPQYYELISNISFGGTVYNQCVIRPRTLNLISTNNRSRFYLRVKTSNPSNNPNSKLRFNLTNDINITNDPNNFLVTNWEVHPKSNESQRDSIEFLIDNSSNSSSNIRLKLTCECYLGESSSLVLNEISIYDVYGEKIVEGSLLNSQTDNYARKVNTYLTQLQSNDYSKYRVFNLADEPFIGNFRPTEIIINYIKHKLPDAKFFGTWPTFEVIDWQNSDQTYNQVRNNIARFLKEDPINYLAVDIYPFGYPTNILADIADDPTYKSRLIKNKYTRMRAAKDAVLADPNHKNIKLISVDQLHSWGSDDCLAGQLREPTMNEIISSAFMDLTMGYNGILYWYSGPTKFDCQQALYKSKRILDNPNDYYTWIFDTNKIANDKKAAINHIANFLSSTISEGPYTSVGDLINNSEIDSYDLVGNGTMIKSISMGDSNKVQLKQVEIIKSSEGTPNLDSTQLFLGVNSFIFNENTYFSFTNLNRLSQAIGIRILLNSINPNNLLKITAINDQPQILNQLYSKNTFVNLIIPEKGAIIIKVENINE